MNERVVTEEDITRLTGLWYRCLVDHHKDRDCHFFIEETWSYGNPPTYSVSHEGYINDRYSFDYPTRQAALNGLFETITEMIRTEAEWLLQHDDNWIKAQQPRIQQVLKELEVIVGDNT